MARRSFRRAIVLMVLAPTVPASAQTTSSWTVVSALDKGHCNAGAVAHVVERPGEMIVTFVIRKMNPKPVEIALAADGSGRAEFNGKPGSRVMMFGRHARSDREDVEEQSTGDIGKTVVKVPPGIGKRPISTHEKHTDCEWTWRPE